jgi:hypothetical protein
MSCVSSLNYPDDLSGQAVEFRRPKRHNGITTFTLQLN